MSDLQDRLFFALKTRSLKPLPATPNFMAQLFAQHAVNTLRSASLAG
jgi:hypothetical protein